jgi:hypothetical protein
MRESGRQYRTTHNPSGEVHWASRMRENRPYGSYGEGLETDRGSHSAPRQSLTRQLFFRNWKGAVRLDQVRHLSHQKSLGVAVTSSMLAALLSRDIAAGLDRISADHAAQIAAVSP